MTKKKNFAKTIKIFLMDGSPDGRMACELSNWSGKAYKIPRGKVKACSDRPELSGPGVYLLFGKPDMETPKGVAYIGEAENILKRLAQHLKERDFWQDAVVFISKDDNLNKAHIKYLEHQMVKTAVDADRFTVLNSNTPTQSQSADKTLRLHLLDDRMENNITGNRDFSIARILLVLKAFETALCRTLLIENDKMLFAAKYIWYADMLAKKELGQSMTGASYAHLPWGPQLNNYRDLLDDIRRADLSKAEDLSDAELSIIRRIAKRFPEDQIVFEASHHEPAWLRTRNGESMSYSWADKLAARIN